MIEKELKRLLESEGYVVNSLLTEVIAGILAVIILVQIVIPIVNFQLKIRRVSKSLGGGPECHWLYGNVHKVRQYMLTYLTYWLILLVVPECF